MLDPELFSPCKTRVKVSSGFRGESKFKVELRADKLVSSLSQRACPGLSLKQPLNRSDEQNREKKSTTPIEVAMERVYCNLKDISVSKQDLSNSWSTEVNSTYNGQHQMK